MLAFLAAIALARFGFGGRKLFVVLVIGIQMLPQAGLIIPLYVVLARYHQVNTLTGVIITYMTFVLPFSVWTLRGFLLGIPKELEEAAMVDGSTRVGVFLKILLPLMGAGPRRDVGVRVHHDVERVHLRAHPAERPEQADGHRLAVVLLRHEQAHRLGRADGRVDADGRPGGRLLPARPAADRVRADGGGGARMSLGAALVLPSFPGSEPPDWIRRFLADGGRGIVLFAYNVDDLPALAASLRSRA